CRRPGVSAVDEKLFAQLGTGLGTSRPVSPRLLSQPGPHAGTSRHRDPVAGVARHLQSGLPGIAPARSGKSKRTEGQLSFRPGTGVAKTHEWISYARIHEGRL